MATFRIKISDGTTTINLYDGSDSWVRRGGLQMPPPEIRASFTGNPFSDGARLATSNYGNREITIITKIKGTSLADLKTNIRSILRLLNDATQRTLSGFGAQVYLEYQWGDTANQSTFFDILRGDLEMPDDYVNEFLDDFVVRDARIRLTCEPFGRFTNQDIAQATIENDTFGTFENFMDITTSESYGDIPAKMYIKVAQSSAAGTAKVWIAKRSGTRYDDDLWTEGEDESSTTTITTAAHKVTFSNEALATASGGTIGRAKLQVGGTVGGTIDISRINYTLATPPRGQFRVLNYCRTTETSIATEYAKMKWGVGWGYGDKTYTPTAAQGEFYGNSADNTWEVLDLGLLNIPPIAESDIASNNSFELRLFQHVGTALAAPTFVSPSGDNDPSNSWSDDSFAWNDNTSNWADDAIAINTWSGTLEFTLGTPIVCGGIRYYCSGNDTDINQIDIDGYYDGSWNDMFQGAFTHNIWGTVSFTDGAHTMGTFRIAFYNDDDAAVKEARIHDVDFQDGEATSYHWDSDYIFLLPIDEGAVIIDSITPTDALAIDNITDPPNVYTISAGGTILDYPDYVGAPFPLGRENTRLYFLRNDGTSMTFAVDVKYQPNFLVV